MEQEDFGEIRYDEVVQAVISGKIIEQYPDDKPYPSFLIYGKTETGRNLHIVAAFNSDDAIAIVITVYQPDPRRWFGFERRI